MAAWNWASCDDVLAPLLVQIAKPRRPDQADVGGFRDPGELREVEDERLLGGRLGGEVEVVERLVGRKRGVSDALAGAGGVAREHLGFEQDFEELLISPGLLARPGRGLRYAQLRYRLDLPARIDNVEVHAGRAAMVRDERRRAGRRCPG